MSVLPGSIRRTGQDCRGKKEQPDAGKRRKRTPHDILGQEQPGDADRGESAGDLSVAVAEVFEHRAGDPRDDGKWDAHGKVERGNPDGGMRDVFGAGGHFCERLKN